MYLRSGLRIIWYRKNRRRRCLDFPEVRTQPTPTRALRLNADLRALSRRDQLVNELFESQGGWTNSVFEGDMIHTNTKSAFRTNDFLRSTDHLDLYFLEGSPNPHPRLRDE